MKNLFTSVFVLSFVVVFSVIAGEEQKVPPNSPLRLSKRVEVEGKIICIGCELKNRDKDFDPQCTLYSKHGQGLLSSDGSIYSFVDNAKGHLVVSSDKLKGKDVKILGWKFPNAQIIEVSRYSVKDGEKWIAYDFCKSCGFEPGDHKDTDVCDDCAEK